MIFLNKIQNLNNSFIIYKRFQSDQILKVKVKYKYNKLFYFFNLELKEIIIKYKYTNKYLF
jgi:hypothetical protein